MRAWSKGALLALVAASGCSIPAPTTNQGGHRGIGGQYYFVDVSAPPIGGIVTSDVGGIDCGASAIGVDNTVSPPQYVYTWYGAAPSQSNLCSHAQVPWAQTVVVRALPQGGNAFLGWAGDCSGISPTCTLTAGADKTVVALFGKPGSGHTNFSDPALHVPAFADFLASVPGALQCTSCHGPALQGQGIAPSCSACHAAPGGPLPASPTTPTTPTSPGSCTPAVCRPGIECGTISDGCGGTLECGNTCTGSATCGGGGTPNLCGGGASSGLFLGGFFPIGAYGQPPGEFASWRAIGANTVQGVPSLDVASWASQARSLGLKQIRQPIGSVGGSPPAAGNYTSLSGDPDKGSGNVLAWEGVMPNGTGWDEIEFSIGRSASTASYAINTGNALHGLDPGTPTFLNSGINGLGPSPNGWPYSGGAYSYQALFQSVDWVCNDIYPYGGSSYNDTELRGSMGGDHVVTAQDVSNNPLLAPIQGKGAVAAIGEITEKLRAVLPGKAFFSFVEAACVTTSSPVVPPGGIRAEMWDAIIHGARGIMIFAYAGQLNASTGDGGGCPAVPAANAAEIRAQSGLITSLGSVLQDDVNPPSIGASASLPALEAGWRDTPSGKYYFVLNATNVDQGTATITLSGTGSAASATVFGESRSVPIAGGRITDAFGPYAVHVYQVP
jgi:hypothetical protein